MPVLAIVVFLILVLLRGSSGALEVNAREGTISWKPTERAISPQKAQGLDTSTHFIDSARGFEFKKLGPEFVTPQTLTFKQLLAKKGVGAAFGSVNEDPITSELFRNVPRALLVTESPTALYGVEIQFSNELNQSADLWRQLADVIESFHVIG